MMSQPYHFQEPFCSLRDFSFFSSTSEIEVSLRPDLS